MKIKKKLPVLVAFLAMALLVWYLGTVITPQDLQRMLASLGPGAALGYMMLFAVLPAFFFPVAVLALAGGLLFGLWWGSVYTFIGAVINCTVMFFLARFVGREQVEALVEKKMAPQWRQRLSRLSGQGGFLLLIILRLIPAVPYNLINYAFGLTDMSYGSYILASAIGIIPGTLVFINIGDKALDPSAPGFWAALGLLVLLLVITALLGKRVFRDTTIMNGEK